MFTGLVDDVGTVDRVEQGAGGRELRILTRHADLGEGESVAVNGACLTVRTHGAGWFTVGAVVTTLGRTTIGTWRPGRRVNLERALRADARLGGHIVQGHVDDVGVVECVRTLDDAVLADVRVPDALLPLMIPHGSLAVDGVSLTVNALPAPGLVQLSLIDHTRRHTTLGSLAAGDRVHVEADVVGKFVRQLVAPYAAAAR